MQVSHDYVSIKLKSYDWVVYFSYERKKGMILYSLIRHRRILNKHSTRDKHAAVSVISKTGILSKRRFSNMQL